MTLVIRRGDDKVPPEWKSPMFRKNENYNPERTILSTSTSLRKTPNYTTLDDYIKVINCCISDKNGKIRFDDVRLTSSSRHQNRQCKNVPNCL